jgi:hypothetical protein
MGIATEADDGMGLIVHLTDLHLGVGGTSSPADDRKLRVIRDEERTSVRDIAEEQLRRLARTISDRNEGISALVLSGDITNRGNPAGYQELAGFLDACFGSLLPPPERIVATPGNHDVAWYVDDPAKRYEHFIAHCVKVGYVTPPLDGIDFTDSRPVSDLSRHYLSDNEGWFIAPINTSNWSGIEAELVDRDKRPIPATAVEALRATVASDPTQALIVEQLLAFRQFDMSRVSKHQIREYRRVVAGARDALPPGIEALPIAVMHHQLSAVGEREEIKAFESISNLGRVRAILNELGIAITLHGHKHDLLTMWNTIEQASLHGRATGKHEMLVVSGGTIGGSPAPDAGRFATVIEVQPMLKGHAVHVRSAADYQSEHDRGARAYFLGGRRFEPLGISGGHLEAGGFSEGYARLLAEETAGKDSLVKNLSITLHDVSGAKEPPIGFPEDAAGEGGTVPLDIWFNEVADWWQSELIEAPRGLFTHGRRLKLHHGKPNADQIATMAMTLKDRRPTNGRAIATLIDPGSDLLGADPAAPASFPAFCLLQLHIRQEQGTAYLDATAYFRKQEMRYWWPVNIAEIVRVMETVGKDLKGVKIGSITTFAAVAVWQTSRSRVSMPAVDRLYFQSSAGRQDLLRLAAVIAQPIVGVTGEEKRLQQLWQIVLEDLVPPEEAVMDSIPVAIEGIGFLKEALRAQASVASNSDTRNRMTAFADELAILEENGRALWQLGREAKPKGYEQKLKEDVAKMTRSRDRLLGMVNSLFAPVR